MNKIAKEGIELSSRPENLSEIEKFVDEFLQNISINEELYGKIYLAVVEAANNAIFHGNKQDPQKLVKVNFELQNKQLTVDVIDMGDGFDYENLPDPTLPENIEKPNGRGVFIISNLSDKLEFNEVGNEMRITFNID